MTGNRKGPGHAFVSFGSHERDLLHTSILYYLGYLISQHIHRKSEYIHSGKFSCTKRVTTQIAFTISNGLGFDGHTNNKTKERRYF
jgi:hypothetical protein